MTLQDQYGSFAVCDVCGWEDDGVQLANPTSEGGANKRSLAAAQFAALAKYPAGVELAEGYRRSSKWRPLAQTEVDAANTRKAVKHWHSKSVCAESEAYWGVR
ncbi:hypothetical protein L6Q96_23240 [Candidatus Binatia bacterium]|nr:hypothetical protein [Aquabacterium sp.]MCK6557464.1 hypothetical protein [Candidatus Binatia bacterium]